MSKLQTGADRLAEIVGQLNYELNELLNGDDSTDHQSGIEDCARQIITLLEKYK